jgi:hypothetical protein
VAFQVKLVLFQPAHVELLARGASLQLAGNVFFVVADDPAARWSDELDMGWRRVPYFVIMPVVLMPSVR